MNHQNIRPHAVKSLVAIESLSVLTSIHHLNELGMVFVVPAILVVTLPPTLMYWFLRHHSPVARWAYIILAAFLVLSFGLVDGLWNHTIKMIVFFVRGANLATMAGLPFPPVGSVLHEVTGVLVFIAALFSIYFGFRFISATNTKYII